MSLRSPIEALRNRFLRRRVRIERLTHRFMRAVGRALLHAERYNGYAGTRERALLGSLQDLKHEAELVGRRLTSSGQGARPPAEHARAVKALARRYARVLERSRPIGAESLVIRELRRANRSLRKLETAFGVRPTTTRRRTGVDASWSLPAATQPALNAETGRRRAP